jgi:hypothetical protein
MNLPAFPPKIPPQFPLQDSSSSSKDSLPRQFLHKFPIIFSVKSVAVW